MQNRMDSAPVRDRFRQGTFNGRTNEADCVNKTGLPRRIRTDEKRKRCEVNIAVLDASEVPYRKPINLKSMVHGVFFSVALFVAGASRGAEKTRSALRSSSARQMLWPRSRMRGL